MRHQIAVPDVVFDDRGQVAAWNAAAPIEFFFDVRCRNGQDVAVPLSRRKAHECVRRIFGRMGTAVHPNRSILLVRAQILLDRDDFLRAWFFLVPNPELQRPAINVRKIVGLALVLEKIDARHVEALGVHAGGVVQGNAGEIALNITRYSVALVFVIPARPLPFQTYLSKCRSAQEQHKNENSHNEPRSLG